MYHSCSLLTSVLLWVRGCPGYWRLARFFYLLYSYASLFNFFVSRILLQVTLFGRTGVDIPTPRVSGPVKAIVANLEIQKKSLGHGSFLR